MWKGVTDPAKKGLLLLLQEKRHIILSFCKAEPEIAHDIISLVHKTRINLKLRHNYTAKKCELLGKRKFKALKVAFTGDGRNLLQIGFYGWKHFLKSLALTLCLMTNFRLIQTEWLCRQQFQQWLTEHGEKFFKRVENTEGKGEIAHNEQFLFSHSIFKRLVLQTQGIVWERLESLVFPDTNNFLTLSQTSPVFYVSAVQVFWKHCGKRRNCS